MVLCWGWVVSDEGHRWSGQVGCSGSWGVKLDVRDLGVILILLFVVGPLPWLLGYVLSFLGWYLSLLFRWIFMGGSGFFVPCLFPGSLHGVEASFLAGTCLRKLRAAFLEVAWSSSAAFCQCWCCSLVA